MKQFPLKALVLAGALALSATAQAATFTVNRFDDPTPAAAPNGCNSGGSCSLREAVLAANADTTNDTIQLASGQYDLSIPEAGNPESGDLDITEPVTILGVGKTDTIINAVQPSLADRVIQIVSPTAGTFTIQGLTIQNGEAPVGDDSGGGIFVSSAPPASLMLSDCQVINNKALNGGDGGGVFAVSGLSIENCNIDSNQASSNGGGLFVVTATPFDTLSVTHSSISNNQIDTGDGGGIYGVAATSGILMRNTVVNNNKILTDGSGGGGYLIGGTGFTIQNSSFDNNQANDNSGSGAGGGLLAIASLGQLNILNSSISNNTAEGAGGGLLASAPFGLTVDNSTIANNSILNTCLGGSPCGDGGGAMLTGSFGTVLRNSTVSGNQADGPAGGVFIASATFEVTNVTVNGNQATEDGGGLVLSGSFGTLNNATITENTADFDGDSTGDGGGIFSPGSPLFIQNSIVSQNTGPNGNPDCLGTFDSGGYNIIGVVSAGCVGAPPFPFFTDPGSTDLIGVNPQLGALANNGGPTETMALLDNSPAIDGGNPNGCTDGIGIPLATDQRGQIRPSGDACDIGAYELGSADLQVTKTADQSEVTGGDQVTYTINVFNNGPDNDFDIEVVDTLPADVTVVSITPSQGACEQAGSTITCLVPQLDAGLGFNVVIVVATDPNTEVTTTITNEVTVAGTESDPDPDNNSDSVDVTVIPANPEFSGGGCGCDIASNVAVNPILLIAFAAMGLGVFVFRSRAAK